VRLREEQSDERKVVSCVDMWYTASAVASLQPFFAPRHPSFQPFSRFSSLIADHQSAMENTYDKEMASLAGTVRSHFTQVVTSQIPGSSTAKVSLMRDLSRLCAFFGHDNVEGHVMPAIITFHIDKDPALRAAFCEYIPLACSFVGTVSTEQFVVPCIENNLVDVEEKVIAAAVGALSKLMQMGLLTRYPIIATTEEGILGKYSALLLHPNPRIGEAERGAERQLKDYTTYPHNQQPSTRRFAHRSVFDVWAHC